MRPYEVMFILDPVAVADDAVDSYIQRFTALLAEHGGQVTGVDKWGKRRFADAARFRATLRLPVWST